MADRTPEIELERLLQENLRLKHLVVLLLLALLVFSTVFLEMFEAPSQASLDKKNASATILL